MRNFTTFFAGFLLLIPYLLIAQKPIPEFSANDTAVCAHNLVYFTDSSKFFPTSWKWYFSGGIPDTSTLQNPPPVLYNTPGYYSVKLIVGNSNAGTDSITKTNYIHVYPCLGVSPISSQFEVSIYPNPANSFLFITVEKAIAEPTYLSILDIIGRPLLSEKENLSQSQLTMDISSLSPGIYFIKFQTHEGLLVRKFVKE